MKKTTLIVLTIALTFTRLHAQCTNDVTIPDPNFKANLIANTAINTNGDDEISCDEASAYTGAIILSNNNIVDLTGIEAFVNITELNCKTSLETTGANKLTSLNISNNLKLEVLNCSFNPLTNLDISNNTNLKRLLCSTTELTTLNLSNNTNLTHLTCDNNNLSSIDLSNNPDLVSLSIKENYLNNLDTSNNTNLVDLDCSSNPLLTNLDTSNNTSLVNLDCSSIPLLTNLDLSNNVKLITLNYAYNSNLILKNLSYHILEYLNCSATELTTLDLSNYTSLQTLVCDNNPLTNLDLSKNTNLEVLMCTAAELTTLDLSNNTGLLALFCDSNRLTNLDLSKNTNLDHLSCENNALTTLDLSSHTNLILLRCANNSLTSLNIANGNNTNLISIFLSFKNNPNLTCIQVDDVASVNASSWWISAKDATTTYSTNCSATASIIDTEFNNVTILYPNPVKTKLNISLQAGESLKKVQIYNLLGKEIVTTKEAEINLENLNTGIYMLKIESNTGKVALKKIIKN